MPLIQWIIQNLSVQEVSASAELSGSSRLLATGTVIPVPAPPVDNSDRYSLGVTFGIRGNRRIRIELNFRGETYWHEKEKNDEHVFMFQNGGFTTKNSSVVLESVIKK